MTLKLERILKFILLPFFRLYIRYTLLATRFHGRDAAKARAIKKAKRKHAKDNKRYRVFFLDKRYRVICRDDIRHYKKAGVFNYFINSTNIDHLKFYDTNTADPCL